MNSAKHIATMRRMLMRDLSKPIDPVVLRDAEAADKITSLMRLATGCQEGPALELAKLMFEDVHGRKLGNKPRRLVNQGGLHVLDVNGARCLFDPKKSAIVNGADMQAWVSSLTVTNLYNVLHSLTLP